jgi:hypothetical protein
MANGTPKLPNGKRDNMKANQPSKPKQAPMDVTSKKKAKNDHELQVNKMNRLDALAKKSTAGKAAAPKPMPAPRGTASGMAGKPVAKGSKNPISKLINKVKRGK